MPDFNNNACAGLSTEDRESLWQAAQTLAEGQSFITRVTQLVGDGANRVISKVTTMGAGVLGEGWQDRITGTVEQVLWKAMDAAALGLDAKDTDQPWRWFNKAVVSATGMATGFLGLPGALIDIPITTLLIMRSIADIARAMGEDPATEETKHACLQVLAFGGGNTEDDPEVAYWATRAALTTLSSEMLIRQVAPRLGLAFSEKALAQAAPLLGAFSGGAINYVFMDYFQQVASVHFTLRRLERVYADDGCVRACFDHLVRQARAKRRLKPSTAKAAA